MHVEPSNSPSVSVDGVVFQFIGEDLFVLLIKRKTVPFLDHWALPGDQLLSGDTTLASIQRCLETKAGINRRKMRVLEQLYTFDNLRKDPRGPSISVSYLGLGRNITPKAGVTTESPLFFSVDELPEGVPAEHIEIIDFALKRLRSRLSYTNTIFALLPELFTLRQLQNAYEKINDQDFDKRNFRKKFLNLNLLTETSESIMEGAHRPAKLYRFKKQKLAELTHSLEQA